MSSRREMLAFLSLSRLPAEFQEVEYLESTGTQYVDTGVVGDSEITSKISFLLTQLTTNNYILAAVVDVQRRCFQCSTSGTGYFRVGYGNELQASSELSVANVNYITETKVENGEYNLYLNGTKIVSISTQTFTTRINLYLFAINYQGNNAQNFSYTKLYSCKIYDNNVIVRDFVPCYRKADNVAGLYDLVNGVFYTNAGTGDFIVGGNV